MYRDIHWIHYHCENAQDVLDTVIQAYRVSEHPDVLLPTFVTYDGWRYPTTAIPSSCRPREAVDSILPPLVLPPELDFVKNLDFFEYYSGTRMSGYGYIDVDREYMERRYQLDEALNVTAKDVIRQTHKEYVEAVETGLRRVDRDFTTSMTPRWPSLRWVP